MNTTIEITEEKVRSAYENAKNNTSMCAAELLENLFGKELFQPKDITARVKTFEDAVSVLGTEHMFVKDWEASYQGCENWADDADIADVIAFKKLRIICAALNEGWTPQFTENEYRYYPYFYLYTKDEIKNMDEEQKNGLIQLKGNYANGASAGFACALSSGAPSDTSADIGSRLCFKTRELAIYAGRQFADLYADFYLIRK